MVAGHRAALRLHEAALREQRLVGRILDRMHAIDRTQAPRRKARRPLRRGGVDRHRAGLAPAAVGTCDRRAFIRTGLAVGGFGCWALPRAAVSTWRVLPFAQKLDMAVVGEAVRAPPDQVLAVIARHGVRVLRVRSSTPDRAPNPVLARLALAPAELLERAEFRDTYEGRVVLRGDPSCDVPRDTILIRETASTYTLLHEFLHSQLRPTDDCRDEGDVELRFALDFRRLQVYQKRLFDDPYHLLLPQWRDDILDAQGAVVARLFRRLQIGQSQEAIAETVLAEVIDDRSPHFDATRRAQGLAYAIAMVDNAIDLFNGVDAAIAFVRETVAHLREQVRTGQLETPAPNRLQEADARRFEEGTARFAAPMARVRAEIERLKRFMST
jgi:hypothetical protein